jgi:hypothetical protein
LNQLELKLKGWVESWERNPPLRRGEFPIRVPAP